MPDIHKSLRLGDLLVEKGLITHLQLREAIDIQRTLQSQRFGNKKINVRTELGEILIELGFISRQQLHSNLNWQRRLKATTAVMVFIAPLLTAACGGGGGGGASTPATGSNVKSEASSSVAPVSTSPKPDPTSASSTSAVSSSPQVTVPSSSSAVSSANTVPPVVSSSAASSSSSSTAVEGSVQLYWNVPNQRENGDYLDITEIGGYELRYKLKTENVYKTISITSGFTDAYYFDYLTGDYEFQIATFDTEGLYSNFVSINPR